jgi:hypothetical protein
MKSKKSVEGEIKGTSTDEENRTLPNREKYEYDRRGFLTVSN